MFMFAKLKTRRLKQWWDFGNYGVAKAKCEVLFVVCFLVVKGLQASEAKIHEYSINLPEHRLRFSLPEELSNNIYPKMDLSSTNYNTLFRPQKARYDQYGSHKIISCAYFFTAMLLGEVGELGFEINAEKINDEYPVIVETTEDLRKYIEWGNTRYHKLSKVDQEDGVVVSIVQIGGTK
jgi:hypothetical protein